MNQPSDDFATADNSLVLWNPLSYFRLISWYIASAPQLRTRPAPGLRACGTWLSATLIWFPIFTIIIGLQLGTIPRQLSGISTWTLALLAIFSWLFSGWLGQHDQSESRKYSFRLGAASGIATLTGALTLSCMASSAWIDVLLEVAVGVAGIFAATLAGNRMSRLAAGQLLGFILTAYRNQNLTGILVSSVLFIVGVIFEENQRVNLPTVLRVTVVVTLGIANTLLLWTALVRG